MTPLTAEEIAELRSRMKYAEHWLLHEVGLRDVAEERLRAVYALAKAAPRLLDEVEQARRDKYTPTGHVIRLLRDELKRARALLKRIEFEGTGRPRNGKGACPECGGIFDCQHEPGCELAALTG